jgi:predicted ATPase
MLFEDVHWADPSTLEALDVLIDRVRDYRLTLLVTHRPGFEHSWNTSDHVAALRIARLSRPQSIRLVLNLAGKQLPAKLLEDIAAKTDGVPLYVEELTKALLESDLLRDAGDRYDHASPLSTITIPPTLRDLLTARFDRFSSVKEVAQVGSALGRDFGYEMLRSVSSLPGPAVDDALQRLTDSGLVFRRGVGSEASYTFKHALVQDAAYDSLLKSSRQELHQKIASVLRERFPAVPESRPELLAHHYTEGGLRELAVPLWCQAGKNAVTRSANLEAIGHLSKGLEVLKSLPPNAQRDHQELLLETLFGNALMAIKGYGAPDVGRAFDRARELCTRFGETPQLFPVLRGLWMYYLVRSELVTARELANQVLELAERTQQLSLLLEAHRSLGMTCFFSGDFREARRHLEQGISLYDPEQHREHAVLYQTDPGAACLCYLAATLWIMGLPDQAMKTSREGLSLANKGGHAFTRSFALFFAAVIHQFRREVIPAQKQAEADIAFCKEERFPLWLAMATIVRGWARAEQGRKREGIGEIDQGLKAFRATGAMLANTYIVSMLGDAYRQTGRKEEGLSAIEDALASGSNSGERLFEAELLRLKAELTLGASAAAANRGTQRRQAEGYILQAIDVARRQGARALELRATMSLCRLWIATEKQDEGRRRLEEIYASYTEGLGTGDLQDAQALLQELHVTSRPAHANFSHRVKNTNVRA